MTATPVGAVECTKALTQQTAALAKQDQDARAKGIAMSEGRGEPSQQAKDLVGKVDQRSARFIKEVLRDCGWPRKSVVGDSTVEHFTLLVIHAQDDPPLQRYALHLMESALATGEAEGQSFALLTDKVLRAANLPQRYGTQLDWSFEVQELENPAEVDARRAALGMPPLSEYVALVKEHFSSLKKSDGVK